jgi:hypothetical protein
MRGSTRAALLRLCSHAYPRSAREQHGEALVDLAEELVEAGSHPWREAAGLVAGGSLARLRGVMGGVAAAPWHEARARLALPLAAALFALTATGAGGAGLMRFWVGWSVPVLLAAAAITLAGAATGRRWPAASGAALVTAMLALDAIRDVYGSGSRWQAELGSAVIDVLVMWLPAGLLMVLCAGALSRVPAREAIRRLAWGVAPGALLFVVASRPAGVIPADRVILLGGFVAAALLVVLAIARRRTDRALPLVAALVLAAVSAPALWLVASFLPPPPSGAPQLALGYFALGGLLAATAVVSLARVGSRATR